MRQIILTLSAVLLLASCKRSETQRPVPATPRLIGYNVYDSTVGSSILLGAKCTIEYDAQGRIARYARFELDNSGSFPLAFRLDYYYDSPTDTLAARFDETLYSAFYHHDLTRANGRVVDDTVSNTVWRSRYRYTYQQSRGQRTGTHYQQGSTDISYDTVNYAQSWQGNNLLMQADTTIVATYPGVSSLEMSRVTRSLLPQQNPLFVIAKPVFSGLIDPLHISIDHWASVPASLVSEQVQLYSVPSPYNGQIMTDTWRFTYQYRFDADGKVTEMIEDYGDPRRLHLRVLRMIYQ